MRLRRLDLTRYGKFTGHRIDFGEKADRGPDLHVVYGPNEAGKSTALAAFLDLLFGIRTQSPFNFLHPYSTMRIDGVLEFADGPRAFGRIKRPHNSLLDGREQPLPESVIQGELGIDREAYCTMFSLDDETLEAGGESILASKGDLGQLLFSASAGLADLSRSLTDVRALAEAFYRHRARSGELATLKERLDKLKSERQALDTVAADYKALVEQRERAQSQYEEALTQRSQTQTRLDGVRHYLGALPRLAAVRSLREQVAPLADIPDAPQAWRRDLTTLMSEEIELGVRRQARTDDIARLTTELDGVTADDTALRHVTAWREVQRLRARFETAEKDLPDRELKLREADLIVASLLERIERSAEAQPERLLLSAAVIGELRALIESRSAVDATLRSTAAELSEARRRLAATRAKLQAAGAVGKTPAEMAALAAAVGDARGGDHRARQRLAARSRDAAAAALADRLRQLHPWHGTADDLAAMSTIDPAAIRQWRQDTADTQAAVARHAGEVERLAGEAVRLRAEHGALLAASGVVGDDAAGGARTERELAWAEHRRQATEASADTFEAAMRRDDLISANRLAQASQVARAQQLAQSLAVADALQAREADLHAKAMHRAAQAQESYAAAVKTMSPALAAAALAPDALLAWLDVRARAIEAQVAFDAAERDLAQAVADADGARAALTRALAAAAVAYGPDADLEALLSAAQDAIARQGDQDALTALAADQQRDMTLRETASRQAAGEERRWTVGWTRLCARTWLGENEEPPSLGAVREILTVLADLGPALDSRAGLRDRIDKMKRDIDAFREAVAASAAELGIDAGTLPSHEIEASISERLTRAEGDAARREILATRRDEAEREGRNLAESFAVFDGRRAAMTAHFKVETLAEVDAALRALEQRAALRDRIDDAERAIIEATGATTIAEAEAALDAADRAALDAERGDLEARFADQDLRCHELFALHAKAVDAIEAIGGDGAVAELEEQRRTTLLEIEEGALRYLRLRAGIAAMERALHVYRERHRSSMLANASKAFRTISQGAYAGLSTQPAKDSETLIARPIGGGSKRAEELSKGTRFQLYLALRMAGYYEFARNRAPVPFIADDIMETFDDARSAEAFRLFAEMAEVGQVIYLTHHRHLCDIASQVCPQVRIHDLSQRAAPAALEGKAWATRAG